MSVFTSHHLWPHLVHHPREDAAPPARDPGPTGRLGALLGGVVAVLVLIGLVSGISLALVWAVVRLLVRLVG